MGDSAYPSTGRPVPDLPPASSLRCGNIKAPLWPNVSENRPYFAAIFSRPFKDQFGAWRYDTSFGLNDFDALMNVDFEDKGRAHCSEMAL